MRRRYELYDEQWGGISGLMPPERDRKARPARDNREMVNAMVWVLRTGAPWRDLPAYYGSWHSAYTRLSRWNRAGIWGRVLKVLTKDADPIVYLVDATIVKVHQDARGAQKGGLARSGAPVAACSPRSMP
jgi:transposase